jgi:hypothetical protein
MLKMPLKTTADMSAFDESEPIKKPNVLANTRQEAAFEPKTLKNLTLVGKG